MNANHDGSSRRRDGWPDDTNRPVFAAPPARSEDDWWSMIGLSAASGERRTRNEIDAARARTRLLAGLRPTGFIRASDGAVVSFDDVVAQINRILDAVARRIADEAAKRRADGAARLQEALAAPDADELIEHGPWAGFARGVARAWCWNLFQYEPHGFVHPGSQVRAEALRLLEEGGLPTVFGYPQRAEELAAQGLTPQAYRAAQEALGRPTYSARDVVFSTHR